MNATKWTVDGVTTLVLLDDGRFSLVWAGVEFGPRDTLEELAEGSLLAKCLTLLNGGQGEPCERHTHDWGGISTTILL